MAGKLLEQIKEYWTGRAPGYSECNREELAGVSRKAWLREIEKQIYTHFPKKEKQDIQILDIGTGPGFFAIILAEAGYQVTAVDYTPAMLDQAKANAGVLADSIDFRQMDGQRLTFPDESFDVVISRNLTWVLEHPRLAYQSWKRVLRSGGLFLNFDANWYHHMYDSEKKDAYMHDREEVRSRGMKDYNTAPDIDQKAMEEIVRRVPLGRMSRPDWDMSVLRDLDMRNVFSDCDVWKHVWTPLEQINFASTPIFLVSAVKA